MKVDAETHLYDDDGSVVSETIHTVDDYEFVIVNRRHQDKLEVYWREPGEELPFVRVALSFYLSSEWPAPPDDVEVDPVAGTIYQSR